MLLAQLLADDKAQAHSNIVDVLHISQFTELLEQLLLILFADSDTRVLHLDQYLLLFAQVRYVDFDEPIVLRELDCILDQIDEDLL